MDVAALEGEEYQEEEDEKEKAVNCVKNNETKHCTSRLSQQQVIKLQQVKTKNPPFKFNSFSFLPSFVVCGVVYFCLNVSTFFPVSHQSDIRLHILKFIFLFLHVFFKTVLILFNYGRIYVIWPYWLDLLAFLGDN